MGNRITAESLLAKILLAGEEFIGTIKEMNKFISDNEDSFQAPANFAKGDLVYYRRGRKQPFTVGRFEHIGAGPRAGLYVIIDSGQIVAVHPKNVRKYFEISV